MSNNNSKYLFIDTISHPAIFALFDADRRIVARAEVSLRGSESERFFDSVFEFLSERWLRVEDLDGIVVVNGPGGFTSMRIVTLALNTIAFVRHVPLYPLDFFGLLVFSGAPHPYILRANRGEYLIQSNATASMELVPLDGVESGVYSGIGEENDFENGRISIQSSLDYDRIIRSLDLSLGTDRIEPIYIKKPNIVVPKF